MEQYINISVEVFPKKAAMLPSAELKFFERRSIAAAKMRDDFAAVGRKELPGINYDLALAACEIEDVLYKSWCDLQQDYFHWIYHHLHVLQTKIQRQVRVAFAL